MRAEPESLRIGNTVLDSLTGKECSVDAIDLYGHVYTEDKTYDDFKRTIQPDGIPLTEEWLIKFGFEKSVNKSYSLGYEKEYNVFRLGGFTYNGIQAAWWYHGLLEHQPEFVHQLQNLYYSLVGSELSIKETV